MALKCYAKTSEGWKQGTMYAKVNGAWTSDLSEVPSNNLRVAIPYQDGTLYYTGSAQSPSWKQYLSGHVTIGGTTSATEAGDYEATFSLNQKTYRWTDGTAGAKTVPWTIGRQVIYTPSALAKVYMVLLLNGDYSIYWYSSSTASGRGSIDSIPLSSGKRGFSASSYLSFTNGYCKSGLTTVEAVKAALQSNETVYSSTSSVNLAYESGTTTSTSDRTLYASASVIRYGSSSVSVVTKVKYGTSGTISTSKGTAAVTNLFPGAEIVVIGG